MTLAFVFVDCAQHQHSASIGRALREVQGVLEVYSTTGVYDLIVKVSADDETKLQAIIASIKSVSGVMSAITNIVYSAHEASA
ncbi:putative 2-isopropylmalate synthase [Candidatus Nitrososphaera gargensis Ga9.2]|uniref:Putative 2-isopropylmalate synthase n=1 Tax=Nitrososphaera gargensis (strain Ga9.2) TaxID=1237085 RepID=K0INW0_NITGG|nr:Lrp/AsnC ligand binding domain-containing protein [Candidatus Nitrososphaera gargensis]AFU60059.1 putative 2-isopropylmalate synthase [Candidatus Nitrososphaera gargensis Ga9.2]